MRATASSRFFQWTWAVCHSMLSIVDPFVDVRVELVMKKWSAARPSCT
jgi:hypothetical protein